MPLPVILKHSEGSTPAVASSPGRVFVLRRMTVGPRHPRCHLSAAKFRRRPPVRNRFAVSRQGRSACTDVRGQRGQGQAQVLERCDLRQRFKHEPPSGQPRVGKDRVPSLDETSEVQDVHVDFPGAPRERGHASSASLHFLDRAQESLGRAGPQNPGDRVPEAPLFRVPDRIGTVEGRNAPDPREAPDLGQSRCQVSPAVADVGAQAEVRTRGRRAPVSTPLLRAGPRLPRPLRTRRRRHPLLLPRPAGPPRRTRSRSLRGSAP